MKIIITSGYYNPLHKGHVRYLNAAKNYGDYHVAIVNNDLQVKLKGSQPFMNQDERAEIVKSLRSVDEVIISIDKDLTVNNTIQYIINAHKDRGLELMFAKGGDRTIDNIPEKEVCDKNKIIMVFNVGGDKIQHSSKLLSSVKKMNK